MFRSLSKILVFFRVTDQKYFFPVPPSSIILSAFNIWFILVHTMMRCCLGTCTLLGSKEDYDKIIIFAAFFQRFCLLICSASIAFSCFSFRAVQLFRCFSAGQGSAASSLLLVRAVQLFRCFSACGNRSSGARWACGTSS